MDWSHLPLDIFNHIYYTYFHLSDLYLFKRISRDFYYKIDCAIKIIIHRLKCEQIDYINRIINSIDCVAFEIKCNLNSYNRINMTNNKCIVGNSVYVLDLNTLIIKEDDRFIYKNITFNDKYLCAYYHQHNDMTKGCLFSFFDMNTLELIIKIILYDFYIYNPYWYGIIDKYFVALFNKEFPKIYLLDLSQQVKKKKSRIIITPELNKITSITYHNGYALCFHEELIGIYDMRQERPFNKLIFQIRGCFHEALFEYPYLIFKRKRELEFCVINIDTGNNAVLRIDPITHWNCYLFNRIFFVYGDNIINAYSLITLEQIGVIKVPDHICRFFVDAKCVMMKTYEKLNTSSRVVISIIK